MSIYIDPSGQIIDVNSVIFSGLNDSLVACDSGYLINPNISSTLIYLSNTISVNPNLNLSTLQLSLGAQNGYYLKSDALGNATWSNISLDVVTSITGTTNQVIASQPKGNVVLSLPQDISTTSNVIFGNLTAGNLLPKTNLNLDIGSSSFRYRNMYIDKVYGNLDGDVLKASQTNITSLGNLTALNMAGDIMPTTSGTRDIGSSLLKFKDCYLSETLYANNVDMQNNNALYIRNTAGNNTIRISGTNSNTINFGDTTFNDFYFSMLSGQTGSFWLNSISTSMRFLNHSSPSSSSLRLHSMGSVFFSNKNNQNVPLFTVDVSHPSGTTTTTAIGSSSTTTPILQFSSTVGGTSYIQSKYSTTTFNQIALKNDSTAANAFMELYSTGYLVFKTGTNGFVFRKSNNTDFLNITDIYVKPSVTNTTDLGSSTQYFNNNYLNQIYSNSLAIGTTSQNASAILEIQSTTKGVLPPKMTSAQKTSISSPPDGLLIFDDQIKAISYFCNSTWQDVARIPKISLLPNATVYTNTTRAGTCTNQQITFNSGPYGVVNLTLTGGYLYKSTVANNGYLGLQLGNLNLAYALWTYGICTFVAAGVTGPLHVNFDIMLTLTANTPYTIYLSIASDDPATIVTYDTGGASGNTRAHWIVTPCTYNT